jgi:hypothetical protein
MRLKGEDVSAGLREWVKAELKDGPKQGYDLGKFFFSVSAGTIGALATIEKLNPTAVMDRPMLFGLALLFASVIVSLNLARPRKHSLGGEVDLLTLYEKQIASVRSHMWVWTVLWLIGTLVGGYAVRSALERDAAKNAAPLSLVRSAG